MAAPITFVVPGLRGETRGAGLRMPTFPVGIAKDSITLATAQRGAGEEPTKTTAIPGKDVVVLQIEGGPELWLHPETAKELLEAQQEPPSRATRPLATTPGDVAVPAQLQWRLQDASSARGATRGFLGKVLLKAIHVLTGFAEDKAADFAASKVVQRFDSRVDPGVYRLDAARLDPLKGAKQASIASGNGPSLVLLHGTFSQTSGTFGKLWTEHPSRVRSIFESYDSRVYALDHPTLGVSPVANAITLAEAASQGARLHLLSHSRGGLVAEVLARVCADPSDGFTGTGAHLQAELRKLAKIVQAKKLAVDRVVRVACPARGTLLASKRLDAYISVLKWALELAHVPVADELVAFIGEVAKRRADPETLPGLAAQIPDSPLIQWLHRTKAPIPGDLRVIAGDVQGDSVVTWVKTLLSDAFFWTDNDLVVQTRSMYGGTPRGAASTFMLEQGGKTSHFSYFANEQTATAITEALTSKSPSSFRVIGPLSWGGESSTGVRAAVRIPRRPEEAAELPALFLLPGILGSNLKVKEDRIWLGWRLVNGFERLAYDPKSKDVQADGPLGLFYDDLAAFLSTDHDVKPFGFDWRRPMRDEAKRLARDVEAALDARKVSKQPVRFLAHSMGGLLARTLQLEAPKTWERMMSTPGSRLLMLGTPNGGSYAPMQVLSGDDTFGNLLTTVGAPFQGKKTRQYIAGFPGLLQLQAGLLDDLGKAATWQKLAKDDLAALRAQSLWHRLPIQLAEFDWGVPEQAVLDAAAALRRDLDRQREDILPTFANKILLVVGRAKFTPADYASDKEGVVYLDAAEGGDGRVPLESALLPGVATWVLNAEHGSLPRRKEAFEAYRELLREGRTSKLPPLSVSHLARGASAVTASEEQPLVRNRAAAIAPPQYEHEILQPVAAPVMREAAITTAALQISVVNGDLTYTPEPLLIGHYQSSRLMGAEAVMDRAIGGQMGASLALGLYPSAPGDHRVFLNLKRTLNNPWQLPRPEAVIVAGLGAEGELRGTDLVSTVRDAVKAWAQRLTEQRPIPAGFRLATTLMGSGGLGVTAGQAAQLVAQGVHEANEQLAQETSTSDGWPRLEHLTIIELYLDRASEAWSALQTLADAFPARYAIAPIVEERTGALRRPPEAGYRGADYDFLSAISTVSEKTGEQIVFTVNTKRARSDVRPQPTQLTLVRNLVETASNIANADPRIGATLFKLLVPVDLEAFMASSTDVVLELDDGTASIPWEVLEPPSKGSVDDRPWSIRTKLLRKLRTSTPAMTVAQASPEDRILVIGDPACDRDTYPQLDGARREADAVVRCLKDIDLEDARRHPERKYPQVESLISAEVEYDANAIINRVMERPWRIIHIAGHGDPPLMADDRVVDPRGVVLSGKAFLGPREIAALRDIPELVFVNCCFLGSSSVRPLDDRPGFASGVARELIAGGVRCVIAAGWAVADDAAADFATTFYEELLKNRRFIDAVAAARTKARGRGGNTWAAYQCYGDPDWSFWRALPPPTSLGKQFASIASSPSLVLALDRIGVESEFQVANPEGQAERLRYLESTFAEHWGHRGDVAEAFGHAWRKSGRPEKAIAWYERARTAEDGRASLAAIEQLVNVRVRVQWERARGTKDRSLVEKAREEIGKAIALLDTLLDLAPTVERESLYGSAYKRGALLEAMAGNGKEERAALSEMERHYERAEQLARDGHARSGPTPPPLFYPAMNRIAAQLSLGHGELQPFEEIRASMTSAPPDFWSVVGQSELDLYEAVGKGRLAADADKLLDLFSEQQARVKARWMWASVHDNATLVLGSYARRASKAESDAARRILEKLESFTVETSQATAPAPAVRTKPAARRRRKPRKKGS